MLTTQQRTQQQAVIQALGVRAQIEPQQECRRREQFLCDYLQKSGSRALVLGISGGVDSLVAGLMAQHAVTQIRAAGGQAQFIALRLPYGRQHDEDQARQAVEFIQPDRCLTVNIQPATDAVVMQLEQVGWLFPEADKDFIIGNIKARQRMLVQYACAASEAGLVVGSDHAAEALMGYFTKYGDGAADVMPLTGLTKTQVRALAAAYGAPQHLIDKVPTADLESGRPLLPDEESFGISYNEIDAFLTGHDVSAQAFAVIMQHYTASAHKRQLPAHP